MDDPLCNFERYDINFSIDNIFNCAKLISHKLFQDNRMRPQMVTGTYRGGTLKLLCKKIPSVNLKFPLNTISK